MLLSLVLDLFFFPLDSNPFLFLVCGGEAEILGFSLLTAFRE